MASIVVMVKNKREFHVLNIMFQSYGFEVIALDKSPQSFLQAVQFKPSYLILELGEDTLTDLEYISNLQSNVQMRSVPIITFGENSDPKLVHKIQSSSNCHYMERPLKTSKMLEIIKPQKQVRLVKHSKEEQVYAGEVEYITKVMDPATSAIERIEIISQKIGELLAFPFTVAKVLNVTESDKSGAKDLARAIEIDPVVVSSVLKVANSALFARNNARIVSIKDAIVRLGFTETKNIAISLSVMNLFSEEERSIGFSREEFWFHSLSTAVIAGKLAQRAHFPKPELAFICGLLHDFGIILLDEFFPAFLQATLQSTMQKGVSFLDESRARWGMTYNDVVIRLFDSWNLPEEVKFTIASFHKYEKYENENNPILEQLVKIVGVSQTMAKSLSIGRECDEFVSTIDNDDMKAVGVSVPLNFPFFDRIFSEMNMYAAYLKLSKVFTFSFQPTDPQRRMLFYNAARNLFNPYIYNLYATENMLIEKHSLDEDFEAPEDIETVIVDLKQDTTLEEITPLFTIEKSEEAIEEEEDEEEVVWINDKDRKKYYCPVILLGKSEHITPKTELPEHVTIFPDAIDLRVFSYVIESLNLGNKISFSDLFKRERITKETPSEEEKEESTNKENSTLSFKTRVVKKKIIVIELFDNVTHSMLPNIKNLLALALKKSHYVAIDISEVKEIAPSVISLIKMIKTRFEKKQIILTLCAITEDVEYSSPVNEESLLQFHDDEELLKYVLDRIRYSM